MSQYCRDVEDHLTRVNGGHLVRIVGQGFELVRQWAEEGIPLSVVFRGIDLKADRHRLGSARRPLRIEFCEADVREVYDGWRRAVGLRQRIEPAETEGAESEPARKRASLTRHLDRAIERLSRTAGRVDLPEPFLQEVGALLEELGRVRDLARGARGAAREALEARLPALDDRLLVAARAAASPALLASVNEDAASDLASFRQRLGADGWDRAVKVTVDRLLRDRFGLPTIGV